MADIWETYRGGAPRSPQNAVNVSINNRCVINLSRAAAALIGTPESVMMHYNRRDCIIGLTAATPDEEKSFPLKPRPDNCGYVLSATPFCRSFGISLNQTERFDAPELNDKGMLCLDLKRTHIVAQLNPRKKRGSDGDDNAERNAAS